MNNKWLNTMEVFDDYELRFAAARGKRTMSRPWLPEDREKIIASTKRMLRYDESLVPQIHDMQEVARTAYPGYWVIQYRFQSWDRMYGVASLYLPYSEGKLPLVFVCCGHGKQGRLSEGYLGMGHRLASIGIAAMVMENIGQGDRNLSPDQFKGPDHWNAIAPFYCGLTLQGLIVMETIALIRYMKNDPRFDPDRFGACGNSGGGTLTMFLAALAPELSVISSCGYPSEATYLLQKERRHCACNLLVGQAHEAEMWEMYSIFAPKPLLLEGGTYDNLIPMDLAHRNARKVRNTYVQMDSDESVKFRLTDTKHPWDVEDLNLVSDFLSKHLLGVAAEPMEEIFRVDDISPFQVKLPADALTTEELSKLLSGISMPAGTELEDVFQPTVKGKKLHRALLQNDVGRGDVMRVFAQYECTLFQSERTQ